MNYEAEKQAILGETDFWKLSNRLIRHADLAAAAARRNDVKTMHTCIRLGHWTMFREADFKWKELDMPIGDEHTHAIVGDTSVAAFAAAIEADPPPKTFDEALILARASRGN